MSMTETRTYTAVCDFQLGCSAKLTMHGERTKYAAMARARRAGWSFTEYSKPTRRVTARCPDHNYLYAVPRHQYRAKAP